MARRGQNEGSIYKRSDGRWAATITLGYEGSKRKRKTFYGETRREVQEQLTKALADIQKGLPLANERITVEQYLERWLAESAPMALRLSTAQSYAYLIRSYILPDLGRITLVHLAPQDVQQLLTRKLASGLSPRTVQYIHAVLRRTLNQAMKWGLVTRNVATMIDAPRVDRPEAEPFTPEEARAFLASVHGDRLEALYTVAFALGLRRGEALALRWEDLDWDKRTLRIRRTVGRVDHKLRLSEPKSRQSRRTIMLPEIALAALRAHQERQAEERKKLGEAWHEHGLIFPSSRGTLLEPRNALRSFQQALKRAGLRHQRFHDMRHACATLLFVQGVHPRMVMEILGHSRISITMDLYSHVLPVLQDEAARRMDAILGDEEAQKPGADGGTPPKGE